MAGPCQSRETNRKAGYRVRAKQKKPLPLTAFSRSHALSESRTTGARKAVTSTGPRRRAGARGVRPCSGGFRAARRAEPDHRGRVRCHEILYWISFSVPVTVAPLLTTSNVPSDVSMVGLDHGFFFGRNAPAMAPEVSRGGGGGGGYSVVLVSHGLILRMVVWTNIVGHIAFGRLSTLKAEMQSVGFSAALACPSILRATELRGTTLWAVSSFFIHSFFIHSFLIRCLPKAEPPPIVEVLR